MQKLQPMLTHDIRPGEWTAETLWQLPDDGYRYEIIDGELFVSPAPAWGHQDSLGGLHIILRPWVDQRRTGKVFLAPFDVILSPETIVQPDLVYIDREALKNLKRGLDGAPTLAVEFLSPSTAQVDRVKKLNAFARHGVPFYWLVDHRSRTLEAYRLVDGAYSVEWKGQDQEVFRPALFPGLEIALDDLWPRLLDEEDE